MKTPKLTDIQLLLLATAIEREDGSLLPPPEHVRGQATRIRKAIPPLLKRELVVEMDVIEPARMWRQDGDKFVGITITAAGRALLAAEQVAEAPELPSPPSEAPVVELEPGPVANAAVASSKIARVTELLRREGGATLQELIATTGWLPHTTRAALTGLRKKGHSIARSQREQVTVYTIVSTTAGAEA